MGTVAVDGLADALDLPDARSLAPPVQPTIAANRKTAGKNLTSRHPRDPVTKPRVTPELQGQECVVHQDRHFIPPRAHHVWVRIALLLALMLGLSACGEGGAPEQPDRRVANYDGKSPAPDDDQCALPVEHRKGGWFCYGTPSPTP